MKTFRLHRIGGLVLEKKELTRGSGILLSISSLPSAYGIGMLGKSACRFVDLLVDLKQSYWQILPIGPTGFGDSPYQPLSACAGNHYWIDLDDLIEEGLLTAEEVRCYSWGTQTSEIDYATLFDNRYKILWKAFERFDSNAQEFGDFVAKNEDWLVDYAIYMSMKMDNMNKKWQDWPKDEKNRQPVVLAKYRKTSYNTITFWMFCQYKFYGQWTKLKEYANARGIQLIGDIPFYVGLDSVDTWSHSELFLLDEEGIPECIAAATPDKFSSEGQIWGSPLYDWERMEEDDYRWWRRRIRISSELFDIIRVDHFVGMVKSYTVDYGSDNALNGKWLKGPGRKLTEIFREELGGKPVIADDYTGAALLPGVRKLMNRTGWMGSRVLMFAFDGDTSNEHLPHNYTNNHVVTYAATHDNDTIVGAFRNKTEYELAYLYEYLNIHNKDEIPDALIRAAYASTADVAMIQMQDILKLGNDARMNQPSTVGGNWRWRMDSELLDESRRAWIRNLAAVYRR